MHFIYQKSAKKRGIEGLLICTVFLLCCLAAGIYIVYVKHDPNFLSFINNIVVWILGSVVYILYSCSYKLYLSSGGWDIQITDTEVLWKTPLVLGEKNFQVSINQISKIVCESTRLSDSSNAYYLCLTDSKKIVLESSLSGINLSKFIKVLEQRGVKYEHIES